MKKLIVGFLSLAMILTAQNVSAASVTWNTASNDCKSMAVANATTYEGYQNPCWPATQVSASAGDVVNVRIYYHNTGTATATNARVVLSPSTGGASTTKSFTGRIVSDQGSLDIGPVTVNISSAQTVTFVNAKWYTTDKETFTPLLNGQSGQELFTDQGLAIGSIAPGWATQGSFAIAFKVSSNTTVQTCNDPSATNYHGSLPCQYPTQLCQDPSATNYHGALPCTYPQVLCQDPSATNYHGSLPCVYPQILCQDPSAINYHGSLPCQYPVQNICHDPSALNYNGYGNCVYPQYNNCTINLTANTTYITSGSPVTLNWYTNGCTSATLSGPGITNTYSLSGTQVVYPTYTSTYILTGYGSNGQTQTQSVTVNVNSVIPQPIYNACAVTTIATNLTQTSAQLNGLLTGSTTSTSTYFEYGTTVNLGLQTPAQFVSGNVPFTQSITGLNSNTAYYFRLVSNCSNGTISRGSIESFYTLGAPVVTGGTTTTIVRRPVIVQGTTVIGTSSPIMLKIEDRYESIGVGDTVDYTITYQNIGSTLLTHPILQVVAPKGIVLTNASRGTYSVDTNTLTVELEDLYPGAGGTVYAQGRVDSVPTNTAQIVTTAILVYTTPNGAQENAIAYVLNKPKDMFNNNLGAAAFFAGLFPNSLLGWLLLIILILLLILLARRLYSPRPPVVVTTHMPVPPQASH